MVEDVSFRFRKVFYAFTHGRPILQSIGGARVPNRLFAIKSPVEPLFESHITIDLWKGVDSV